MADLTLYQITNGLIELMEKTDSGEISEEDSKLINEELCKMLETKSSNIIGYLRNEETRLDAVDVEIKRLQEIKKVLSNRVDRYKDYIKENMIKLNLSKIDTTLGSISVVGVQPSVEITDETKIPNEFKEIVQETKIKKRDILASFKETGEIPEGCEIITNKKTIRIK